MAPNREKFPELAAVLELYYPHCEQLYIDPDAPLDTVLSSPAVSFELVRAARAQLARIVEAGSTEAELDRWLHLHVALPTATTWASWARYVISRLDAVAGVDATDGSAACGSGRPADPSPDLDLPLPRVSRFADRATANAATTQVLRVHERRFRTWVADRGAPTRLHLYADLPGVGDREEGLGWVMTPARPQKLAASSCVVLMARDQASGQPYVATSYPERDLTSAPRERFPELQLLFGGYFGQDHESLDGDRWAAERRFNCMIGAGLRGRLASELEALLEADDTGLRVAIEALGSYVLPSGLRRWVLGLHRRMTMIDWSESNAHDEQRGGVDER